MILFAGEMYLFDELTRKRCLTPLFGDVADGVCFYVLLIIKGERITSVIAWDRAPTVGAVIFLRSG